MALTAGQDFRVRGPGEKFLAAPTVPMTIGMHEALRAAAGAARVTVAELTRRYIRDGLARDRDAALGVQPVQADG
jgi:hypothetical protein